MMTLRNHRRPARFLRIGAPALVLLAPSLCFAVIGGETVDAQKGRPENSVVALQLNYRDESGAWAYKKASAVAIGRRTLLTAGHNLFYMEQASDVEAILSPHPAWGEANGRETRIRGAIKIIHPEFQNDYPSPPTHDLAILILSEPLPRSFKPAKLPGSSRSTSQIEVYGYGISMEGVAQAPPGDYRLRRTSLDLLDSLYRFGSASLFWVDQAQRGFCSGDSGGPAFAPGSHEVLGIVSHTALDAQGRPACLTTGAFTDVRYYLDWLKSAER